MNSKFNFTLEELRKASCPAEQKQIRFQDTKVRGLALRVTPSGAKTYIYYRRLPNDNENAGKICELMIGKFDDMKLEQARRKADGFTSLWREERPIC